MASGKQNVVKRGLQSSASVSAKTKLAVPDYGVWTMDGDCHVFVGWRWGSCYGGITSEGMIDGGKCWVERGKRLKLKGGGEYCVK